MILQLVTASLDSGLNTINYRTMRLVARSQGLKVSKKGICRAVFLYNSMRK